MHKGINDLKNKYCIRKKLKMSGCQNNQKSFSQNTITK